MDIYYISNVVVNFLGDGSFLNITLNGITFLSFCFFSYGAIMSFNSKGKALSIIGGTIFFAFAFGPFSPNSMLFNSMVYSNILSKPIADISDYEDSSISIKQYTIDNENKKIYIKMNTPEKHRSIEINKSDSNDVTIKKL